MLIACDGRLAPRRPRAAPPPTCRTQRPPPIGTPAPSANQLHRVAGCSGASWGSNRRPQRLTWTSVAEHAIYIDRWGLFMQVRRLIAERGGAGGARTHDRRIMRPSTRMSIHADPCFPSPFKQVSRFGRCWPRRPLPVGAGHFGITSASPPLPRPSFALRNFRAPVASLCPARPGEAERAAKNIDLYELVRVRAARQRHPGLGGQLPGQHDDLGRSSSGASSTAS